MTYSIKLSTGQVIRDLDGMVVAPCQSAEDPNFLEYTSWVSTGNTPLEVPAPVQVIVPEKVTRRQMLTALHRLGILDNVKLAVASSNDIELQISFDEALEFERSNPAIMAMASVFSLTDVDLDNLFIQGSRI